MGDVTADIKTRYSIFVPKPLSRINMGDWQKRDGSNFSAKFGYAGVSIQSEQNLFVDITKTVYLQTRGSFVAHASDWLQCSLKPMTLATGDNATVASDAVVTVAAGAGQSPTYTLDHGDSLETVPYINLQLHYRVEEVQSSIFEFFRGRREKDDPFRGKDFGTATFLRVPELFKKEVVFDSSPKPSLLHRSPKGAKEGEWDAKAKVWKDPPVELAGGFELIAEKSWQELFGKKDWDYKTTEPDPKDATKKVLKKFGPHDIFGGLKDIRRDPDPNLDTSKDGGGLLHDDVAGNAGKLTRKLLKFGFSGYFSRFDPYLLLDPIEVSSDPKLGPLEKTFAWGLAILNNVGVELKRCTDVLYKLATLLRDNALIKLVQNTVAAVDAFYQPVKAIRGNAEMLAAMGLQNRGWWGEQIADEALSGAGKRGLALNKQWAAPVTTKAAVRSMAPYKDPTKPALTTDQAKDRGANQDADPTKGFYGGQQRFGGGYILPGGTQLKDGDQIHIKAKNKEGADVEFDTPPLVLNATSVIAATGAVINGAAVPSSAWTFDPASPAKLKVTIDGNAATATTVDLSQMPNVQPSLPGAALAANACGANSPLVGTTLTLAADGGAATSYTFTAADVVDQATLRNVIGAHFTSVDASITGGVLSLKSKKCGPGASLGIPSCTASTLLGVTAPGFMAGPTTGDVQAYVATRLGSKASLTNNALTLKSSTTGATSRIDIDDLGTGLRARLGLGQTSATGVDTQTKKTPRLAQDLTADDLVALFSTVFNAHPEYKDAVTFTSEDGQVVITGGYAGPGAKVEVSGAGPNGGNMKTALQFMGDVRGEADSDHVQELPGVDDHGTGTFVRGLDDFDKADTEIQKLPDDMANVLRPVVVLGKNAIGMVSKTAGVAKAVAKVGGLKLPTPKGSIGLIANKGISLGTPDRIVGAGGQGVIFIADGGTGLPDHAKYVLLEDTFNRIFGGDFFAKWEPPKDKPSLGFRVFSDTTADLVARNTAHVLALGRTMVGADAVGCGVARVAGSYAVELVGQEKVVIGARSKDLGRVEVLGATLAIGYTQIDLDDKPFGLVKRGPVAGWPNETKDPNNKVELTKEHVQTSSVIIHSTEQACIVVGPYMVQVRDKEAQRVAHDAAQARVKASTDRLTTMQKRLIEVDLDTVGYMELLFMSDEEKDERHQEKQDLLGAIALEQVEQQSANAALTIAQAAVNEGVYITMRDPDSKKSTALTNVSDKTKPAIYLNEDGITITTKFDTADADDTGRVTLKNDGTISVVRGKKKAGFSINAQNEIEISNGVKKAKLTGDHKFQYDGAQVDFSAATKIMLG